MKVVSVDVCGGPMGAYGFRSGRWTAVTEDGRRFTFYYSLPHEEGLNEERLIWAAQFALDRGRVRWV